MPLVAGIDSSTQSCKVVVCDADSGAVVRTGTAPHPPGTEVHPRHWWAALELAIDDAGGVSDVAALAVGGQQHGLVCLDESGAVVRDALLWNDLRSAPDANDLIAELPGGAAAWATACGSVPVASFTVTKLRWLARAEPQHAARAAAVCLPHDWLTWQLAGASSIQTLCTDRGDASGTGYWSPATGSYLPELLELAFGRTPVLPGVLAPSAAAGETGTGAVLAAGTGDNAAAALGLDARPGDVIVSIGTSGVICAVSTTPTTDSTGLVAGFADATGAFLPLACTLNAAPVLDAVGRLLGVDHDELARLALSAPPGADGLVLVPYFEGERTPNLPDATGAIHGARLANTTPAHLARAAVEGVLCGLADGMDALRGCAVPIERVLLVGGGARSVAVQALAADILGVPVAVPMPDEYVARGAARQAAWASAATAAPPTWQSSHDGTERPPHRPESGFAVRERYRTAAGQTLRRPH
jgi:xylulokinase